MDEPFEVCETLVVKVEASVRLVERVWQFLGIIDTLIEAALHEDDLLIDKPTESFESLLTLVIALGIVLIVGAFANALQFAVVDLMIEDRVVSLYVRHELLLVLFLVGVDTGFDLILGGGPEERS
jgi:hypothetical protein